VYPASVPNKSYSFQVALIISERGAEICFCAGAGTSQVADPDDRRRLEAILENTRDKLTRIPSEVVNGVERSLGKEWFYRTSWHGQPDKTEFRSLREWLNHASSPQGNAASVSVYFDPNELTRLGDQIAEKFRETLRTFTPLLEFAYGRLEREPRRIAPIPTVEFGSATLLEGFEALSATNLQIQEEFFSRFVISLAAKPFVILTGNSGTGKTKLAQLFAEWLTGGLSESHRGHAVVPVGADWTDNRNVIGFVNHLRRTGDDTPIYQGTAALDLLLSALAEPERPFFLILDEMNLSHVERYFADFLSAMESRKAVPLHSEAKPLQTADGRTVPHAIPFPDNLFVIGTVNVDETTYMFSPKVLDRANVIEFRVTEEQAAAFLTKTTGGLTTVEAAPKGYAEAFLRLCRDARETPSSDLALATHSRNVQAQIEECHRALRNLFVILRIHRQEFAYRTISEVLRYVYLDFALSEHQDSWRWNVPIDAQILQKVLPKLHGSKRRIGSLLTALAKYCERGDVEEATSFARDETNADTFNANEGNRFPTPQFPGSYEKLCEMIIAVRRDQFVSFIQ